MECTCIRCGKKYPERHYLIHIVEYLGTKSEPRKDICDECYTAFQDWLKKRPNNAN